MAYAIEMRMKNFTSTAVKLTSIDFSPFEKKVDTIIKLGFSQEALPKLKSYIELLWRSNEELNLFSRKMSFAELVDNHLIDCLLPLKYFPFEANTIADFGSGGGLPGVLYALNFSTKKFLLFEKSPKKQAFLNRCKLIANNIEIHSDIPTNLPNVDLIMSRAFKPIDVTLEMSRGFYQSGGHYFLLKGRKEKIDLEVLDSQKKFSDLNVNLLPLTSPVMDVERNLVVI